MNPYLIDHQYEFLSGWTLFDKSRMNDSVCARSSQANFSERLFTISRKM